MESLFPLLEFMSPTNKIESLEEINDYITSSLLVANSNFKAVCGDFNVNLDNNKKIGRREQNLMKNFMTKNNLVDSVDILRKNNKKLFTYVGEGKEKSRIDYIFLSPNLLEDTNSSIEQKSALLLNTDHNMQSVVINKDSKKYPRGEFFDINILEDTRFIKELEEEMKKKIISLAKEEAHENKNTKNINEGKSLDEIIKEHIPENKQTFDMLYDIIE